uniref:Uncharacterized protein n=1 Tax=Trichogramma kaykai TaxID=54128 RepID=A0ABD2WI52_9HYME
MLPSLAGPHFSFDQRADNSGNSLLPIFVHLPIHTQRAIMGLFRVGAFALLLSCAWAKSITTYDQRQDGQVNVQIDVKDVQIVALMDSKMLDDYQVSPSIFILSWFPLARSDLYRSIFDLQNYDYIYDYNDFTIKPGSTKPPKPTTPTTAKPPVKPSSVGNPQPAHLPSIGNMNDMLSLWLSPSNVSSPSIETISSSDGPSTTSTRATTTTARPSAGQDAIFHTDDRISEILNKINSIGLQASSQLLQANNNNQTFDLPLQPLPAAGPTQQQLAFTPTKLSLYLGIGRDNALSTQARKAAPPLPTASNNTLLLPLEATNDSGFKLDKEPNRETTTKIEAVPTTTTTAPTTTTTITTTIKPAATSSSGGTTSEPKRRSCPVGFVLRSNGKCFKRRHNYLA